MDTSELLFTALRATFVYFFLLLVVRILGKREIGATSAFDLIVALILGEVVDEIIYGDVTLLQGVTESVRERPTVFVKSSPIVYYMDHS
jgi:uncharacterized membrane protein YcaP (DUF421 family)